MSREVVALDAGFLIAAAKNDRRPDAFLAKWLKKGAAFIVPAPALAEVLRGGPSDAPVNWLINSVATVVPTSEAAARRAGNALAGIATRPPPTVDALIVATALDHRATMIATSDRADIESLAGNDLAVVAF